MSTTLVSRDREGVKDGSLSTARTAAATVASQSEPRQSLSVAAVRGSADVAHLSCSTAKSHNVLADTTHTALPPLCGGVGLALQEAKSEQRRRRQEQTQHIEADLTRGLASHLTAAARSRSCCHALAALSELQPALGTILRLVSNCMRELGVSVEAAEAAKAEALARQEKTLYDKYESFFEGKMRDLLQERAAVEANVTALQERLNTLRRERDEELTQVKTDLMRRLSDYERREQDFEYYRQLIASVYKTNEQLTRHNEDLERVLLRHHLDIPAAPADLLAYSGRRGHGGGDRAGVDGLAQSATTETRSRGTGLEVDHHGTRLLPQQVPVAFIAASKTEMQQARLNLQEELLHCAFDERSAYRLQVNGLKQENANLKYEVKRQEERILELTRYIHEKRFLHAAQDESAAGDVASTPVGDEARAALTPRPRDIPFSVQTELGIDLMSSTAKIVAELAAVSTNLKQQLHSTLLRVRQLSMVNEWMSEETLLELDAVRNEVGVLATFAVEEWPNIPHFLRTRVSPTVSNLCWSETATGAILLDFFRRFDELREHYRHAAASGTSRDDKALAPRSHQLYERRALLLTSLDATAEAMAQDVEQVPFGYVVSQYIKEYLIHVTPASVKALQVVLPATRSPFFVAEGERHVVELEAARFGYSLWWAVQRYSRTQPLCRLFLEVVHGHVPVALFRRMEQVLRVVHGVVHHLDVDGTGRLTYQKVLHGTLKLVADLEAPTAHSGTLAVAQTFESNALSPVGGRVARRALLADESHCVAPELEGGTGSGSGVVPSSSNVGQTQHGAVPPHVTVRHVPPRTGQPLGASVFVRYWRRVVLERHLRVYSFVEHLLLPLVRESEMVLGLYLLPLAEATARLRGLDQVPEQKGQAFVDDAFLSFPFLCAGAGATRPRSTESVAEEPHTAMTNTLAAMSTLPLLRMPDVTRQYLSLLEERRDQLYTSQAARHLTLERIFAAAVDALPRLSHRIHFPFYPDLDMAASTTSATARPEPSTAPSHPDDAEERRVGRGRNVSPRAPSPPRRRPAKTEQRAVPSPSGTIKSRRGRTGGAVVDGGASVTDPNAPPSRPYSALSVNSASTRRSTRRRRGAGGTKKFTVTSSATHSAGRSASKDMTGEREMVEWYGFCAQLRQQLPSFTELLFHSADGVDEAAPLSLTSQPAADTSKELTSGTQDL